MRFSGHESFACRYAWLPKAFRALSADSSTFLNEENAMVVLGVGKNMVRSMKFWVEVMGIATPKPDRSLEPTPFAHSVFARGGFDPYLEDTRTLWLLHWKIASRWQDPLFAWDFLFNKWPYPEFTRSEALAAFMRETRQQGWTHSEVTLAQHLDVFIHTYAPSRNPKGLSEDSLDSPLAGLELLQLAGERRVDQSGRREPIYAFRREPKHEVTERLFEYCLDDYWKQHSSESTLTFRDVATAQGSLGQVFKLPEVDIHERLEKYASPHKQRLFTYQPSAIQGLVTRPSNVVPDLLSAVYAEEPFNA